MDSVLEGAIVLSLCKLACSLPFLHSVVASTSSPVSFCCHCLLVFTDVILTVFLSCLLILERWQTVAPSTGDTIALRCLLFLCHTYGVVLLLTFPDIILDTLIRHLHQHGTNKHQNTKQNDPDENDKRQSLRYHVVAYLCCLTLWIFGTLNIRLRWKLEEDWAVECLHTKSLLTCLPNIYSPMVKLLPPFWGMASVYIAITTATSVCIIWSRPEKPSSPEVDNCTVRMFATKDVGLSLEYAEQNTEQKDQNCREKVIRLTLTEERKAGRAQSGSGLGAAVMIGVVCVLVMFALPLHLAVNIHLFNAVEKIAERSMKRFGLSGSAAAHNPVDTV
ncbi:uncharacterized protein [Eucyclogobius newberryi]|uniref:uncharacterized protein n=1 Tax=Eucyclogobius newberryi TaxID=166745 RepID=UPI003B5A26E1